MAKPKPPEPDPVTPEPAPEPTPALSPVVAVVDAVADVAEVLDPAPAVVAVAEAVKEVVPMVWRWVRHEWESTPDHNGVTHTICGSRLELVPAE